MTAPWIAVIIALWACQIVMAAIVAGVLLRLASLTRGSTKPDTPRSAPVQASFGGRLPEFAGTGPDGEPLSSEHLLETAARTGTGFVLLFVSGTCGPCHRLLGALKDHRPPPHGVPVHLIVDPAGWHGPELPTGFTPLFQERGTVSRAVGVRSTPTAVAVASDGHMVRAVVPGDPHDLDALADAVAPARRAPHLATSP